MKWEPPRHGEDDEKAWDEAFNKFHRCFFWFCIGLAIFLLIGMGYAVWRLLEILERAVQ